MTYFYDTFSTPFGEFSAAVEASGAVVGTAFGNIADLRDRFTSSELIHDMARIAEVRHEISEYFSGRRPTFSVQVAPVGTPFQQQVWSALQQIPFGGAVSYGELARVLGRPKASRAVGRANATNPICLIVPCHRVIGADGSLTGFAFGEEIKRRLLEHEGAFAVV
ncbi:MAG: methylated-DNA--[protein]-cysteine S-methyltransferase [Opitutus sp.]